MSEGQHEIAEAFHKLYYELKDQTWNSTRWLGYRLKKSPIDLWTYQEIIYDLKPDLLIETGTSRGGSAYFFASLFDLIGHGEVLTIDVTERGRRPVHPRITYLTGSSTADDIMARVRERCRGQQAIMVVLDSDHREPHVRQELELYSPLVTPGSYLVVEDTNVNGHPAHPAYGPGPMEAVREFLAETDAFEADREQERHLISFYPNGWLKRRGGPETHDADRGRRRAERREQRRQERSPVQARPVTPAPAATVSRGESALVRIALLRGVNVGGSTTVAMADLRHLLTELGFEHPQTLLQSGNLLFASEDPSGPELERLLETELERRLGLRTAVMVRTAAEWQQLVASNPFADAAAADPAHLVVMVLKETPPPAAVTALRAAITGPETVAAAGNALYLIYPDGIGRSKLTIRLIETTLGTRGTGRNWNTVRKLAALAAG